MTTTEIILISIPLIVFWVQTAAIWRREEKIRRLENLCEELRIELMIAHKDALVLDVDDSDENE